MNNKILIDRFNSKKEIDKQIKDAITTSDKNVNFMIEVLFDRIVTMFNNGELYCSHRHGVNFFDVDKRYIVKADTYSIDIGDFTLTLLRELDDKLTYDKLILKCENTKNKDGFEINSIYKDLDICDENDYIPRIYHYLKAFNIIYENSNRRTILNDLLNN